MIKGKLNNNTRKILKDYYINYYLLKIEYNLLNPEDYRKDIEELVDNAIKYSLEHDRDNFFKYIANRYYIYNCKHKFYNLSPEQLYEYALKDDYFKSIFIKYYENVVVTNTKLNSINMTEDKETRLRVLTRNEILNCMNKGHSYLTLRHIMANKNNVFWNTLDIKSKKNTLRNKVIDGKTGDIAKINFFKRKYVKEYLEKAKNFDTKLTTSELKKYFKVCIPELVDCYFNEHLKSTIRTYVVARVQTIIRLLSDEYALIKYVRKVPSDYYKALDYYTNHFSYLVDNKDEEVKKEYERLVKYYIDNSNFSVPMVKYLKNHINKFINERNKPTYDINKVLEGNLEEKEKMIKELHHIVDYYVSLYPYFDTLENVKSTIEEKYLNAIEVYLKSSKDRPITSYIHTRLKQYCDLYYNKTIKKKSLANLIFILRDYALSIDDYKKHHRLSLTDKANLDEYMSNVLEDYINKGKYVDNKKYFDDQINYYHKNLKR